MVSTRRGFQTGDVSLPSYIGWALPDRERSRLLALFPPIYPDVIAHHVTLRLGSAMPLPQADRGMVVGHVAVDGVEALVVAIDGKTVRPDCWTYHITWSLDKAVGRKPADSNRILLVHGFSPVAPSIIDLIPKLFS